MPFNVRSGSTRPRSSSAVLAALFAGAMLLGAVTGPAAVAGPGATSGGEIIEGRGVGVLVEGMIPVTGDDGNLTLQPISRRLALKSCRPLMRDLAPAVPIIKWHVSSGWENDFPSHATRHVLYDHDPVAGQPSHFLHCFMPGTYDAGLEPTEPTAPVESAAVRARCAKLAKIDFTHWTVTALDQENGVTSAALRSPNGFSAGCVLGANPRMPIVWIPEKKPDPGDVAFVHFADPLQATDLALSGFAGRRVTNLVLTAGSGEQVDVSATAGWFAGVGHIDGAFLGGDLPVLEAFDRDGDLVWQKSFPIDLLPAECVASYEEQHGC